MERCDLKTFNECWCEQGRCAAQPQTTPAPVPRFTVRDQLIIISFGFAVSLCVFVAMSAWNVQLGKEALDCQEACVSWQR